MSKERLEEIEKNLDPLGYGMGGHLISVNDIYWLVGYAKEQAERAEYYEAQNEQKIHAFEEIIDLLNEDYFENWEQAIEVAHEYKKDFVRAEKISSDLRIRETKESLKEQNKRYREALEFYAKRGHYIASGYPNTELLAIEYGEIARNALKGESK